MDAAAEQLVLDYLRELEDAARHRLGPAERTAFMARSRAALARQIGETRATEAGEVRGLLRRFGDPDRLVAQERHRLDEQEPGPGGVGPAPDDAERPAASTPAAARPHGGPDAGATTGRQPAAAPALRPDRDVPTQPGPVADQAAEQPPSLHLVSRWSHVPPRPAPGSAGVPESGPDDGPDPAGDGEPRTGGAHWLGEVLAVVRRHPLECVAIVLIGLGGLIDPWPLWAIGVLAMFASPVWSVRDKLAGVAIPLAVMLAAAIAAAGFSAHPPGISGYAHEVRVEGWNLLRAGAVVGAAYLARRLQHGRRARREPPWRREPPADP